MASSSQSAGAHQRQVTFDISALDANPRPAAETGLVNVTLPEGSYYADDDSVVSSNVSNVFRDGGGGGGGGDEGAPEAAALKAALTGGPAGGGESGDRSRGAFDSDVERGGGGCVPRSRRECYGIVCIACLLFVMATVGTGLGVGLSMRNRNNERAIDTDTEGNNPGGGGDGSGGDLPLTYSPTPAPNVSTDAVGPVRPPPGDLGAAIEYHTITQEISSIASFTELAAGEGADPEAMTPQQKARDFLVFQDYLPLTFEDEDDDDDNDEDGADDDVLAVAEGRTKRQRNRRPYLTTSTPAYRAAQRFAAAVLYYATDGDDWETNRRWLGPGVHECDWVGVACEEVDVPAITLEEALDYPDELPRLDDGMYLQTAERMIVAIDLPENNLGGTLPMEIAALPYLKRLGLWSNKIGGSLPAELGRLTRLTSLHLDDNALVGNIPRTIGGVAAMTDLFLDHNEGIEGRIPPEIGNLSRLERLHLSDTMLRGPIPTTLGKLTNLVDLSLQNNRLSRELPEELGNLVNLESLNLSGNSFVGEVPASWGNLAKLKKLEIQSNNLSSDLDEMGLCSLREDAPGGGGLLEAIVADCRGDQDNVPRVTCSCCTGCLP